MLDTVKIRKDFPIFTNLNKVDSFTYLDSAATSQKPKAMIDAVMEFYEQYNSNTHRGIYNIADKATTAYENARSKVSKFINATSPSEIIFTGNTNESINYVAIGWAKKFLKKGDIIVITDMEHHANIIPWQRLRDEIGIELFFIPHDKDFRLDYKILLSADIDLQKVKLVSLTHASNVLGTINPIAEIIKFLKDNRIDAKVLLDAAQTVPHLPVDVQSLNCDFLAFSSHKMLGPSGLGVLWARKELLEQMVPIFVGSHMVGVVTKKQTSYANLPNRFEVGTGRLESVVGLGAAISYLESIGMTDIQKHNNDIVEASLNMFKNDKDITLYGPSTSEYRLPTFSFSIAGIHPHDISQLLNDYGICVRSGNHCAQTLMSTLGVFATTRASCYIYNDKEDMSLLFNKLQEIKKILKNK